MRPEWGAFLWAAVVAWGLAAPAIAQDTGTEDDVASRLRAGTLRSMHLGDSIGDFRKQYVSDVREQVHEGRREGYLAQVLDEDYVDSFGRFEAFFGLDERIYLMTVHLRPRGKVAAEGVAAQLAAVFGPPTELRDFGERSVISWDDGMTRASMLVGVRWLADAGRTTIDIILTDLELESANMAAIEGGHGPTAQ